MEIIVTDQIRTKELGRSIPAEAVKLFEKLKHSPELATLISAPGLPERTTLYKVYGTTSQGARRLLFFARRAPSTEQIRNTRPERWVLLFYRDKADPVGANMAATNPAFVDQLRKRMRAALEDLSSSTAENPRFVRF